MKSMTDRQWLKKKDRQTLLINRAIKAKAKLKTLSDKITGWESEINKIETLIIIDRLLPKL